ncbi:3-deoxy-D-manno-octulosonic acid transferase [Formosa maritima]|uniref:3-deoxy-D-manno-octulosonic acid transferase n=1 Tax=Formosa maritima TaxID=2592046 RepID=A0A5D0GGX7_9FLAO|nr:glycosyltransferase N-terminal domain-containing protein [Formosa maritima]TYA58040.1 3-deoxy-D-manno-octulosonic acid transferase [Formosa maritima]
MKTIYNIGIHIIGFVLKIISVFNHKIRLGVLGRKGTFETLKKNISQNDKTLWFHCASLGEYEQGLPVFKELRKDYPKHKIVLSFFSPSGYEIRKNTDIADVVVYLPIDTKANAKKFLDLVHPELTIFVKYDIWPNLLIELKKRQLRAILISALFRDNQIYFKSYDCFIKNALFAFQHIFTQDSNSKSLLNKINYNQVTVSGDTRFDRVFNQLEQNNTLDFIETFKNDKLCIVAGSTWPEDEAYLVHFINQLQSNEVKFIIAPHNIKDAQIKKLKQSINKKTILFSEIKNASLEDFQVIIIDTIGLLSKIYSYGDIAYVGGAVGKTGLHNTLEPAVFGIPIVIGENFKHFPEAIHMTKNNGMFSIQNTDNLKVILNLLIKSKVKRKESGQKNLNYIKKNTGSVIQIMSFIRT